MTKPFAITALVDAATLKAVEVAAEASGVTTEAFVADAIAAAVDEALLDAAFPRMDEAAFNAFVEEGDRDIAEGRIYSKDEMSIWFAEQIEAARHRMVGADKIA